LITGFTDLPDLDAVTRQIRGGNLYSITRDFVRKTVSVTFVLPSAADVFVQRHRSISEPFVVNNVRLTVQFDQAGTPLAIPENTEVEIFSRGSTRVLGLSLRSNTPGFSVITPEDILALFHGYSDPRGGVVRLFKKKTDHPGDGIAREFIYVEFFSIEACLSVRWSIMSSSNPKFSGCIPLRGTDPCIKKWTESTTTGKHPSFYRW
jgi:hypothetical protein